MFLAAGINEIMGRIPNIQNFNNDRKIIKAVKELENGEVETFFVNDREIVDIFRAEVRPLIEKMFVDREVQYYAEVNQVLDKFKENIRSHINDKLNALAEDIIASTTSAKVKEEVNQKVEAKLNEIKDLLK